MSAKFRSPVPHVSRIRAFWESRKVVAHPISVLAQHAARLGDTYYYYFGGVQKVLVTANADVLHHVLKKRHDNYRKSQIQVTRMKQFLGNGLLTSHDAQWRRQRRVIQHGFTPHRLATMTAIMQASLDRSMSGLTADAERGPIELSSKLLAITFDMVLASLFSAQMTRDEREFISNAITRIQSFIVRLIVEPYLSPWFTLSGELRRHETLRQQGDAILLRHIRTRRAVRSGSEDMLQLLLDARYEDSGEGMSDEQILSESMQLLVAGHETSANALSWTLYLLARNPASRLRVVAELEAVLKGRHLETSHIAHLHFTNRVLEEALRLYPPFWMVDRIAIEDDEVAGMHIPAGTTVIAFIYGAQHSHNHWRDPELFRPDRFEDEPPGFHHLPFGAGPRRCVGAGYARLQMLMILSSFLRDFEFELATGTDISTAPMLTLRPEGGVLMNLRSRARRPRAP